MQITAIYLRVSTDKQSTGLEAQKRLLLENYKDKYKLYEDFGVSGSKSSRPALDCMMKDIRDGKIKTVLVYSFSRFARYIRSTYEGVKNERADMNIDSSY